MPLSDNVRQFLHSFLQNAMLTPAQQEQKRQFGQQQQRQSEQFQQSLAEKQSEFGANSDFYNRQLQQQNEEAWNRILMEGARYGITPHQNTPPQAPGGPPLQAPPITTPGDGPNTSGPPPQAGAEGFMPSFMQLFGMQGGQSQTPNAANAQPSGPLSPGSRMPSRDVIAPMTTLFRNGQPQQFDVPPDPAAETVPVTIPGNGPGGVGGQTIHLKPGEYMKWLEMQQKPPKPEDKDAPIMDTAVRDWARENNFPLPPLAEGQEYNIKHVPEAKRDDVQQRFGDLKNPGAREQREASAAQKKASEQELKNKTEQYNIEKGNAENLLEQTQKDPKAFFQKGVSQTTRDHATALAHQRGIPLPTRDLPDQRAITDAYSIDLLQANNRLKQLAAQLGPDNLGAIAGRWNATQMSWGDPITSSDRKINAALQEFQSIAKGLTVREVKQLGGGRAAVQLMNTLQSITPNMKMDPQFLAGAFNAVDYWGHQQIKDNRDYMMGNLDKQKHQVGDIVTIKGKKVRIGKDLDAKGNFTPEPL